MTQANRGDEASAGLPASLAARPCDPRRGLPIPPVNLHPDEDRRDRGGLHEHQYHRLDRARRESALLIVRRGDGRQSREFEVHRCRLLAQPEMPRHARSRCPVSDISTSGGAGADVNPRHGASSQSVRSFKSVRRQSSSFQSRAGRLTHRMSANPQPQVRSRTTAAFPSKVVKR
jgi:hypothetical protein